MGTSWRCSCFGCPLASPGTSATSSPSTFATSTRRWPALPLPLAPSPHPALFPLLSARCRHQGARKKLIKSLVEVPRGASQLLPYYARVTATLSPVFPDVSQVAPPPPPVPLPRCFPHRRQCRAAGGSSRPRAEDPPLAGIPLCLAPLSWGFCHDTRRSFFQAKRDQSTSVTEKLICYMGYVGELCKFRLTPYGNLERAP